MIQFFRWLWTRVPRRRFDETTWRARYLRRAEDRAALRYAWRHR